MKPDNKLSILSLGIKILFCVCLIFLTTSGLFAQSGSNSVSNNVVSGGGIGLGSVIAVIASWSRNQSILWAILHGILSWFYVIYFVFTR